MQYIIGFFIALFIALTGVGAGTVTVPVLVLFLGVPAPIAVGIGLTFSAAVKLILVPAQVIRGNVAWRTLGYMLGGGVPGVLIGSLFLKHLVTVGSQNLLNALLGAILVSTAAWQIVYSFRPMKQNPDARDRSRILPWLMFPVGAEVGFSSAGAGALGAPLPDAAGEAGGAGCGGAPDRRCNRESRGRQYPRRWRNNRTRTSTWSTIAFTLTALRDSAKTVMVSTGEVRP